MLFDRASRVWEIVIQLGERDAGVLLLVGAGEGHPKFQQVVGRFGPLWIVLVALGKGTCRLRVPATRVIGLAQPVLCATGQRVFGMLRNERLQRLFRSRIICLLE